MKGGGKDGAGHQIFDGIIRVGSAVALCLALISKLETAIGGGKDSGIG